MDIMEAMQARHSVRRYLDKPIEKEKAEKLQTAIYEINHESGLHIQLFLDEPKAFSGSIAHYGSFRGCNNYLAIVAENGREESVGYYGETQGVPHKNKKMDTLCRVDGEMPEWFRSGMEAAMMAPTAINQQKFLLSLNGNKVKAKALFGPNSKIDIGIVKYHFELGAGDYAFEWE